MPDLVSIGAAIAGIRHATEIARIIRDSGPTLADAEHKLKLAELLDSLADAKIAIAELKDEIEKRDSEVRRLAEEIRAIKSAHDTERSLVRNGNCYFLKDDTKFEQPYCLTCWDADRKLISLMKSADRFGSYIHCNICRARKR